MWIVKRDLYDWWLNRIRNEARVGHRYHAIFTLAIYAMKCNIPYEELKKDAYSLLELFDRRTMAFTCNIDYIKRVSGIHIERIKRNFKDQHKHLKVARYLRDLNMEEKGRVDWINRDGRPVGALEKEKWNLFCEWKKANPAGLKYKCIKDTGLSKMTVYKYWKL